MGGFFRFYCLCLKRAFSGAFWRVEKWTGGVALVCLIAFYFLGSMLGDERMFSLAIPVWFFLAVFAATVTVGFVLSPWLFFKEEKEKAEQLAKRQQPKLRVTAYSSDLRAVRQGSTSQTMSARRQTVETNRQYVAAIACTNDGFQTVRGCKCSLLAIWHVKDGEQQRVPVFESVQLSWSRDLQKPIYLHDIDPNETKFIYIATVHPAGYAWLYRDLAGLPLEDQQIFGDEGKYQILLQFKSDEPDPLQVLVDLEVKKSEPAVNKLPKAEGKISIVEQGPPPLASRLG